ncbi:MAG: ATP-binding protein [Phycisphaerales bacterium JB060]
MAPTSTRSPDLGRRILEQREAIIAEWEAQSLAEHPRASGTERQALRNALPEFLEQLGRALGQSQDEGDGQIPADFAMEHGVQRWKLGWDVAALARDFMILRRVLVEQLCGVADLGARDTVAIAATLDEAVIRSVSAYTEHSESRLKAQNEALARKNYELKRFAHMVAHEVRSPLSLATLAASSLQRRIDRLPQSARAQLEDAGEQLSLITQARHEIIEVIENLVGFADSDGDTLEHEDNVQLAAVFDQAVGHLKYFIKSSGASITRGDLPAVRGNAVALRSVFQNLIENALKYAGDGPPRVRVTAEKEGAPKGGAGAGDQNGQPAQPMWAIHFRDEGMGISEEDQQRIFGFLSRVNVKESIPGTGVGLALCKRVAEQHGGSMGVRSAPGRGSTFTLRLPCSS